MITSIKTLIKSKIDGINSKFLFSRNCCLFWLSIPLVFSIIIVIRDCSLPLASPFLFLSNILLTDSNSDNTFYNISISYIAAYIFYLVQVYFPARNNNTHCLKIYQKKLESELYVLSEIVCIYKNIDSISSNKIYLIDQTNHIIRLTINKESLNDFCFWVLELHEKNIANLERTNADSSIIIELTNAPVETLVKVFSNNLLLNTSSHSKLPQEPVYDDIIAAICTLNKYLKANLPTFTICSDKRIKNKFDNNFKSYYDRSNVSEFTYKMHIEFPAHH